MINEDRKKLYDALSSEYDLGTYEEFERNIGDSVKRKKLYDAASADYDLGDFESYSQRIGPTHKESLDAFTAEHGSWLNDFETRDSAETNMSKAGMNSGIYVPSESAITGEERKRYLELHKQEEALKKAWFTSDEYLAQKDADALFLSDARNGLNKQIMEYSQSNPVLKPEGAFQINPYATRGAEADTELEKYRTASRILDDAIKMHNAPSKYDDKNVFLKFGKGSGDVLSDADFWTAGLTEIADNLGVRDVLSTVQEKRGNLNDLSEEAIENMLSPAEKAVLQAWVINTQEQLKRKDDLSRAYQAGQGATESLAFMAEFALTGGIGKAATEGVEQMAKWLGKKALTKVGGMTDDVAAKVLKETGEKIAQSTVGKYGVGLAESLAEAAGRTGVMPSTFRNISEKAAEIETDENGNNYLVKMNDAFAKGYVDSFIENLSEGGRVNALGGLIGDVAGKIPAYKRMVDKFSHTKASELWDAFNSSGVMNTLRAGGWHGLGEEYLEEWYGNALRTLTGVDKEALKDFATVDNQIITLTSFLPMTIFGGTVSTAQVLSANKDLEKKAEALKSALMERGYDEAQANNMIDMMRGAAPAEVSETLTPIVNSVANRNINEAAALMKPVGEFAAAVQRWQSFNTKYNYQEQEQRDGLRTQMEETLGQFWQQDENGRQTVQRGVNEKGEVVYMLGKPSAEDVEAGVTPKVAAVTSDGRKVFVNPSEYQLEDELEMNVFLGNEIMAEKGNKEQARMIEEKEAKIAAIREAAVPGTAINIGTAEAPVQVIVIQRNPDGVIVNTSDGQTRQMTYEEFGNYVGVNAVPMTDAQIDEQEADALAADRAQREAALDQEYDNDDAALEELAEAEDEIEQAVDSNIPLPMKADGSVDQNALWNENPERWAQWNDEQRKDGGANTLAYVGGAIAKEQAKIAELQAAYAAESDFDTRDAIEKQIADIQDRVGRLTAIQQGYVAQAEAAAAPVVEAQQKPQTEEEKTKAENQRREPLRRKAKELADKLGVKVNIAESISDVKEGQAKEEILRIDLSGSKERATGWYNPVTGEVTIYLPHTTDVKEIERTIVHEVVAHKGLRGLLGEEGFNVLCDSVWEMMTEEERAKYMAYPGVNGNKRAAADEYIAHYAETLNLEESKPVWDRIMDLVMRILDSMGVNLDITKEELSDIIVASYQNLIKEAEESKETITETEVAEVINEEQLNAPNSGEAQQITAADGEVLADTNGKGAVRFSIRTWNEGGRDYLAAWLANDTTLTEDEKADILARMDEFYKNALLYSDTYVPFGTWSDAGVRYDNNGNPLMSVIKANGDYAMNLDFSLVCKKRRPLNRLLRTLVNRNAFATYTLRERELAEINWILQEHGFEVACALCFVDSKRYRVTGVADVFAKLWNNLVTSLAPKGVEIAHFNYNDNPNVAVVENGLDTLPDDQLDWKKLDKAIARFKEGSVEHKVAQYLREHPEARKLVDATDFIEAEGFESVKEQNPDLLKFYNMKKGTGGPKASFGDVQYLNDILKKEKTFDADKAYAVGGVRLQSFSDFVPHMYFDYMQLFAELAAKKLPVHAYTKEVLFAKIFGLTGAKINLSLVPAVVEGGIAPGLDAEGNYAWADPVIDVEGNVLQQGQSFPYEEAMAIQQAEGYSKNCGIIAVGISDAHIEKMLDDPNIPFIIPYHKSSLNAIVARMTNIDQYKDYTNVQNTRKAGGSKLDKGTKDFNFNEYLHGLGESGTPQQAAQAYLDWCRENKFIPKFSQFAYHPNYYKLLQDFNTIDLATGEYAPQGAVTMTFPTEQSAFGNVETLIQQGLQEDATLEEKMEQEIDGIADQVLARLEEISKEPKMSEKQQAKKMAELADERMAKIKERSGVIDLVAEAERVVAEQKQKEMRDGVALRVIGENETPREFLQKEVDAYRSRFNEVAPITLVDIDSKSQMARVLGMQETDLTDEDMRDIREDIETKNKWGGYGFDSKEIAIFVREKVLDSKRLEMLMMHESIHALTARNKDFLWLGQYMWVNAKKDATLLGFRSQIAKKEPKNRWYDEMAAYVISLHMENGTISELESLLDAANRDRLNDLLNELGYDKESETAARDTAFVLRDNGYAEVGSEDSQKKGEEGKERVENERPSISFRITPEQDKAYMDAVNAGDMETAQRMVIEAAKLAMPNTKVVDEEGNPRVVYHQTNAKVYVNRETGQNWDDLDWREKMEWDERDDWEDYWEEQDFNTFSRVNARTTNEFDGFFFAPKYDEYHEYGERTISAFVNIQNPASREDYDIDSRYSDAGRKERIRLQEAGFDGVIRMDGEEVDEYIAFEPSQVKSADPVTYDNDGNVIPLSERFNPENEDIRFRVSNDNQAIFVSNAAKAVEGIKQEKATPEQWLKMIEKAGGLKAGEDKWMGLSDFLKSSDKKTLTKQEVLDFINENMIVIEETHYLQYAEEAAADSHREIVDKLQEKFNAYVAEYHEQNPDADEYADPAGEYAIEKLREEMEDTFPYTIEKVYGNEVYVTFDYEDMEEMEKWSEKLGVVYDPQYQINSTRLNYTTSGLDEKHEIALTVPTIESWNETDEVHFGEAGEGRAVAWIRFGDTQIINESTVGAARRAVDEASERERAILDKRGKAESEEEYRSLYPALEEAIRAREEAVWAWDKAKKESVTKKILVIDEIQSKRHQEGRNKGYKPKDYWPLRTKYLTTKTVYNSFYGDMEGKYGEAFSEASTEEDFRKVMSESDFSQMLRIKEDFERASNAYIPYRNSVPDAPFDKNWHELAMKRMLRYAAENGYDYIAWTKGEQQAERYNIGGVLKEVDVADVSEGRFVYLSLNGGNIIKFIVDSEGNIIKGNSDYVGKRLSDIVGKELSLKILNAAHGATLSGEDLRIGGEGMRGFYDKMLPAFMNKYGKKWGVKVEDIELPNLEDGLTMHSVPVTEEMKASVMEGQVMFRTTGSKDALTPEERKAVHDIFPDFNEKITKLDEIPSDWFDSELQAKQAQKMAVESISDEHFTDFVGSVILPTPSKALADKINSGSKEILIKRGVFAKNAISHNFTPEQSRNILASSLYSPNLYGQSQKTTRPLNWVVIRTGDKNVATILEVNDSKDYLEVVSWYTMDSRNLDRIKRQAKREGGEILILDSEESLAASLSALPSDLSSEDKDSNNLAKDNGTEENVRYRVVTDQETLDRLNSEPTIKVYRAMQLIDGKLYPPMSAKVDGELRQPIELGQWEEAEERPDLVDEKGRFKLDKGNKSSLKARYNPYFHTSPTPLNDQFSSAQTRPELVTVEVEVPESELTSEYKAEKAKDSVGKMEWKAGVVQSKLSGTRTVILSRWDKPVRFVPDSEVADVIVDMFEGRDITVPSNVVTPSLRAELEKRGIPFVETDNQGNPVEEVSFRVTGTSTDEVVANGLQLTPAQTAQVAANIFAALPEESRKKITDGLNGNVLGLKDAILQIPASLASKENWNEEDKQMADVVAEEMTKMAGEITRPFSAEEGLWLLYNNLNKGTDLISQASRALVQRNLGFDAETLAKQEQAKEDVRFRTVGDANSNAQASLYNRGAVNVWTRLKESFVDMQASVEELVKAIEKRTGKVAQGFENVLLALNQQSSKGLAAMESYTQKFLNPMFDEIRRIMDETKMKYEDVVRYVILKHGLERNKKLAQRDARAHYQEIYDDIISKITGMTAAQKRTYLTNAQLKEGDAKAELATLQAVDMSAMTDEEKREHKKKLAAARKAVEEAEEHLKRAQKIASLSEQEAQDELDKIFEKIENGTDSVYKEMRENDYSGISSMFYDQLGVDRKNFSTEEQYQAALMEAKKDRYSSLKDIEAAAEAEVKSFEGKTDTKVLWKRINAATKETLRQQYEANMISKDQYDSLRNMFEYYVPLRGFKDNTAEDMYTYYRKPNSTGYTKPILGAEGRKTEAESPFGWIAAMAGSAIASNVKNEAKLALYYFVSNRPENGIATISKTWFVDSGEVDERGKKIFRPAYPPFFEDLSSDAAKDAYEAWQENMRELQKKGQAYEAGQRLNLGNAVVNISDANKPEHIVNVKVGGKDYTIIINGNPRAAQAINGDLNIEGTAQDYSALFGPVLRWMSSVNTSYNPEFWITNMMRDMAFTMMAVNIKEDPAYRRKFKKNYLKAFKVISLVAKNENGTIGDSYLEQQYKDFVKYGGVTGYTQIKDSETWEHEIENYLSSTDPESLKSGKVMRGMKSAFHAAHRFGESLEQVSRFAAFLTARETGKSINEAINDAKEITVNFNRKGSGKMITFEEAKYLTGKNGQPLTKPQQWMVVGLSSIAPLGRRFIMFFNAAIQGLNATYKLMKKNPKRFTGWALGYAAVGMMNAVFHAMLDDDDDYLDIPQYERRNSLMIGGNGAYFKWALPQEARAFYALGDLAVETVMGRNPHQNFLGEALKIGTEVLPVNPSEGWKAFMPSVAIPFIELALNEDYKGAPIYNDQKWLSEEEKERTAKWSNAYQGTGWTYVKISQGLNFISGGDKHDAGLINLQPEKLEHLVQSAFGGTIRTADKFINTVSAAIDPEESVTIRQTPFLNRFLTINDERFKNVHVNDVFDYYKADAEHALTLEKQYTKERDTDALAKLRSSDEYQWAKIYSKYKKPLKAIQDKIKVADGTAEKKELMKQQDELKKRMIKEISEL